MLPAIVVVAYNRKNSLKRLLQSLAAAKFESYNNVPIVISIDKGGDSSIVEVAQNFVWKYGEKHIITHKENLGLRNHIISCGNLTTSFSSVIILEDDLLVSPYFYDYAVKAQSCYESEPNISGISLYSYDFNEYAEANFKPLDDGYDNYFVQTASSWGQLWTQEQWAGFRSWYDNHASDPWNLSDPLPQSVIQWPQTSWKKYFIKYMVAQNKYFVYPRTSLTTNYGDAGTNHKGKSHNYQVPLLLGIRNYNFSDFKNSLSIYDAYYELDSAVVKQMNSALGSFDFELDLYGTKNIKKVKSEYLISIRDCNRCEQAYGIKLVPQELNILYATEGQFFSLGKTTNFAEQAAHKKALQLKHLHKNLGWRQYANILKQTFRSRVSL